MKRNREIFKSEDFLLRKLIDINIFLFVILVATKTVADPDLWGHIKFGLDALNRGNFFLREDIYSFTVFGGRWINHEWLSELIFSVIFRFFGVIGLLVLKAVIVVLIFSFIWHIIKMNTNKFLIKYIAFISGVFVISADILTLRPQLFSILFFSMYIYMIKKDKFILSPLIMLLWVNMHGGFLMGLLMGIFYFVKRKNSKSLFILFLLFMVTLINPYFLNLHAFLYKSLTVDRYISEWQSLIYLKPFILNYIFIIGILFSIIFSREDKDIVEILLFFILLFFALKYMKIFSFFILYGINILTKYLGCTYTSIPKAENNTLKKKIFVIFLNCVLLLFLSGKVYSNFKNPFIFEKQVYPVEASSFIKKKKISGNILTYFDWGEYCIWRLYPQNKIFFDGRFRTVYPLSIENLYFKFQFLKVDWNKLFEKYRIDVVLWPKGKLQTKLLIKLKKWRKVYSDKHSVVLVSPDYSLRGKKFYNIEGIEYKNRFP